jgi:diguanylate cyclase (GGDEF)-like protein
MADGAARGSARDAMLARHMADHPAYYGPLHTTGGVDRRRAEDAYDGDGYRDDELHLSSFEELSRRKQGGYLVGERLMQCGESGANSPFVRPIAMNRFGLPCISRKGRCSPIVIGIDMQTPAFPPNEAARLAMLRSLEILDTAPDERFDRLARLAKHVFSVPIAVVSLVDAERQWFKSCAGLSVTQTPRDVSFCGHAILGDDLFVIEDAQQDPRFFDNPLVKGEPYVRFYAGFPLTLSGDLRIGSFCIVDTKPRRLDEAQRSLLRDLARIAERELEAVRLAATDDLTGLHNRRGFEAMGSRLLQLCQRARSQASLLFFDLNGFKQINDGYGHTEGDRAIVGFANVLRAAMRETDVLSRLGGDEFVALVVDVEPGSEAQIIERVQRGVTRFNREARRGYELRFSVGLAPYDLSEAPSVAHLIEVADHAMYVNKRAGKAAHALNRQPSRETSEADA